MMGMAKSEGHQTLGHIIQLAGECKKHSRKPRRRGIGHQPEEPVEIGFGQLTERTVLPDQKSHQGLDQKGVPFWPMSFARMVKNEQILGFLTG